MGPVLKWKMQRKTFVQFLTWKMDDIEDLIFSFMMEFIVPVMIEYAISRRPRQIQCMHNSSLRGNAWLMEMLNQSSAIRCHKLLRMQRHVIVRLCNKLKKKNYLKDSQYISSTNKSEYFS